MKRFLLIALLGLLFLPENAVAQRRKRPQPVKLGMTYGFKLGANFASMPGFAAEASGNKQSFSQRIGPVGGGLLNYRFTSLLSMQLEALYSPRGTKITTTGISSGRVTEEVIKLTYVDVPVLLKANAKVFYGEAGIVPSLLVDQKYAETTVKRESTPNDVKSLDVGFGIGAGIEAPQGAFFGVRYVRSTSAIGQGGIFNQLGGKDVENSVVQVTGGYIFGKSTGRRRR
mgnify:CR=1 FL=1